MNLYSIIFTLDPLCPDQIALDLFTHILPQLFHALERRERVNETRSSLQIDTFSNLVDLAHTRIDIFDNHFSPYERPSLFCLE
jgi:hypothetical protein